MNNRKLYESIMKNVAIQVKKAINEAFEYEHNEMADAIKAIIAKDEQLLKVCANADEADWKECVNVMLDIVLHSKEITKNIPTRITNINKLAIAILARLDDELVRSLKFMKTPELDELVAALAEKEVGECSEKKVVKECDGQCKDGECKDNKEECKDGQCKEQPVKESLDYRHLRRRRF